MKILNVHEQFGALAGVEANTGISAARLGLCGPALGILHGRPTGKNESAWNATFPTRFALQRKSNIQVVTTSPLNRKRM